MLVPLVLRNIVLPYLRGTGAATACVSAAAASSSAARGIASTARHARAEALLSERDDVHWDAFVRAPDHPHRALPPRFGHERYRAAQPVPPPRPTQTERRIERIPASRTPIAPETRREEHPPPLSTSRRAEAAQAERAARPDFSRRAPQLPLPVAKLLDAKLYRAAVFHLLDTPEYMADAPLVRAVADKLDSRGAGKLAARLRATLVRGVAAGPGGRIRLWSEPRNSDAKQRRNPPDHWRAPLVPRATYPEATEQERRTHHWNLLLTQWLTTRRPILYASPFPRAAPDANTPAPARLRRLRDVLTTIDRLRADRGFVPDRVTANIVLKAWLMCLARGTTGEGRHAQALPGRDGLRRDDLREIFGVIAASLEQAIGSKDSRGSEAAAKPKSATKAVTQRDSPAEELAAMPLFDERVSYPAHIRPFTRLMGRAMVRVGDQRGRVAVDAWGERMRERLEGSEESQQKKK